MNNKKRLVISVEDGQLAWSHVPPQASVREVLWALQKLAEKVGLKSDVQHAVSIRHVETQMVRGKERLVTGEGRTRFDLGIIRKAGKRDLFNPPLLNRQTVPLREVLIVAEAMVQRHFPDMQGTASLENHGIGVFSMEVGTNPQIDRLEVSMAFHSGTDGGEIVERLIGRPMAFA